MWRKAIEDHYRLNWGEFTACQFLKGPAHELPADFGVLCFAPRESRSVWTYSTCCMAQPGDTRPVELHMFSPRKDDGIIELLFATAHYHRTGANLGLGHSVNFGRPWLDNSVCDHGLVSLPYLDGPALEELNIGVSEVRCYWLLPISASEVEFKKRNGVDALEREFERGGFDYADPLRRSFV